MRRALVAAAALAAAACKLDFEGAPCTAPGAAGACPSGQACGNDLRCSARAAQCASTRCTPGVDTRCDGTTAEACTAADPACGAWQPDRCADRGLVCGTRSGGHACECPAGGGTPAEFAADPIQGSPSSAVVTPTGAASPAPCRFQSLRAALAAASASGAPAKVKAYGAAGADVVFGVATGESYPLDVPAGVTLAGADAPAGATVVQGEGDLVTDVVTVEGTLERVRVANVSMARTGVVLRCGGGTPTLRDVVVTGAGTGGAPPPALATGVSVAGDCGAVIERTDVSGAAGAALEIAATSASAAVTVTGGSFHGSGVGIQATGGTLVVAQDGAAGTHVTANAGAGVWLRGASPAITASLAGVVVDANGGTGVVVDGVDGASSFTMSGCDVAANGRGAAPRRYGPGATQRIAGGVFLPQAGLGAFSFHGNRLFGNAGDQLAFESDATWSIAPAACGPESNTFACVATGSAAVGLATTGSGAVDASNAVWPSLPQGSWVFGPVTSAPYCNGLSGPPPPPSSCP